MFASRLGTCKHTASVVRRNANSNTPGGKIEPDRVKLSVRPMGNSDLSGESRKCCFEWLQWRQLASLIYLLGLGYILQKYDPFKLEEDFIFIGGCKPAKQIWHVMAS